MDSEPTPANTAGPRQLFKAQGEDGFDQCWFPVALSSEVTAGTVVSRPFLDGKVVVYRTRDGNVHVLSAYCRHLGADLGCGSVVDDQLRCPFHYWQYGSDGRCTKTAAGDAPPPQARLFKFPTMESVGFVWAFNGETPLYDVPRFEVPDSELAIRSYPAPYVLPVDPIVQLTNAFDLQHFKAVHGMQIDVDPKGIVSTDYTISCVFRFDSPELGRLTQRRTVWGAGCVTMNTESSNGMAYFAAGLHPLPGNRCQMYVTNATPKAQEASVSEQILDKAQEYVLRLIAEDKPIMTTIRFRPDMLTVADKFLVQGLRFARKLPRAHPAESLIR